MRLEDVDGKGTPKPRRACLTGDLVGDFRNGVGDVGLARMAADEGDLGEAEASRRVKVEGCFAETALFLGLFLACFETKVAAAAAETDLRNNSRKRGHHAESKKNSLFLQILTHRNKRQKQARNNAKHPVVNSPNDFEKF